MNRLRFRSGQVQLRKVRVDADTVIEAGDLVWLDGDDARPAKDFPWDTDLATTQAGFAEKFLGVAHQQSRSGDADPISVDVSPHSVYEFGVSPASFEIGQPLGPDENTGSLMNQQLEAAAASSAIARSAEYTAGSVGTLRVTFASAYAAGSANANAVLG
ncbi:hypothetical protein Mal4_54050 [Maioricimonas rarisocia]|uniref:Uncharacterized protein n=1 Tax=Maioricimonas rarisocia TaxID=2528026 RepID=A0A517ZEX3_9PLAN|nr:hypothetical protein [Maioricimonas rarisocia]QDU41040.1 hypothetical protein Mal4_54050 [Maioricimonas rarisocia]